MPLARAFLPLACSALSLAGSVARGQPPPAARTVTELGQRYPVGERLSSTGLGRRSATVAHLLPPTVPGADVKYVRVYMQLESGESESWYLTVRDQDLRPVEVLSASSFQPGGGRWTSRVPGKSIVFDLELANPSPSTPEVAIALKEYIAMPSKAVTPYYSSQVPQAPEYRDLFAGGDGDRKRLGDAVGFVMASYDQTSWCCSGVVVGDGLLLTNWHCGGLPGRTPEAGYWGGRACQDTIVDLSWDGDGQSREFRCTEVLCLSRELDFALLRVAPLGADAATRPAITRPAPAVQNEQLRVIHHPECLPKRITEGCSVVDSAYPGWVDAGSAVDFSHRCDTEAGSSGGAVFDAQGRLMGLHHTGFEKTEDANARANKLNTAVRIDRILEFLAASPDSATCRSGLQRQFKLAR